MGYYHIHGIQMDSQMIQVIVCVIVLVVSLYLVNDHINKISTHKDPEL